MKKDKVKTSKKVKPKGPKLIQATPARHIQPWTNASDLIDSALKLDRDYRDLKIYHRTRFRAICLAARKKCKFTLEEVLRFYEDCDSGNRRNSPKLNLELMSWHYRLRERVIAEDHKNNEENFAKYGGIKVLNYCAE
jgi:hypothetical protein